MSLIESRTLSKVEQARLKWRSSSAPSNLLPSTSAEFSKVAQKPGSIISAATVKQSSGIEVVGRVERVLFKNKDTGLAACELKLQDGSKKILRSVVTVPPEPGIYLSAIAKEVDHPEYGKQLIAPVAHEHWPQEALACKVFLKKTIKSVPESFIDALVQKRGPSVYADLSSQPDNSAVDPANSYLAMLRGAQNEWRARAAARMVWEVLGDGAIDHPQAPQKIVSAFGIDAVDVIRKRTYELSRIDGLPFEWIDDLAIRYGARMDGVDRITCAVASVFDGSSQNGHTVKTIESLIEGVAEIVRIPNPNAISMVSSAVGALVKLGAIIVRETTDGSMAAPMASAAIEREIAAGIHALCLAQGGGEKASAKLVAAATANAQRLNDASQTAAVESVFKNGVSIITGRPGCGKTTVTKVVAQTAAEAGLKVVICAPTGAASVRASEATGFPARTIHSLLGIRQSAGGGNSPNPSHSAIEGDVFVVDEAGMIDSALMASLLRAIPQGARLVMVGDSDQLKSVGPGNVFADIIASQSVHVSELKTVHRNAANSTIVVNAHKIIDGRANEVEFFAYKDFLLHEAIPTQAVSAAVGAYKNLVQIHGAHNVQVLAPMRASVAGINALNKALRDVANPILGQPILKKGSETYRQGDRVIRTYNNRKMGVMNGDIGYIKTIDTAKKCATISFGTKEVVHDDAELSNLDLAYAITVHKSQGSEYAGVVLVASKDHEFMLNRNMIYTAITRGKKDVRIIGAKDAIERAISKIAERRKTCLAIEIAAKFNIVLAPKTDKTKQVFVESAVGGVSAIAAARKSIRFRN